MVKTLEYANLKNNLRVFNGTLKRTIRKAKVKYHNQLFNKCAGDIKMTWKTILEIICQTRTHVWGKAYNVHIHDLIVLQNKAV